MDIPILNLMETTTTANKHNQLRQSFKVTTEVEIPIERVADMLCCAFEGGSNYWYHIKVKKAPEQFTFRYMPDLMEKPTSYTDFPTNEGGYLIVGDDEESMPDGMLDLGTIRTGLEVMADKYARHFQDLLNENDDADTGDVFLQCCLYGEVIFG
jgi:hypothetical protein